MLNGAAGCWACKPSLQISPKPIERAPRRLQCVSWNLLRLLGSLVRKLLGSLVGKLLGSLVGKLLGSLDGKLLASSVCNESARSEAVTNVHASELFGATTHSRACLQGL